MFGYLNNVIIDIAIDCCDCETYSEKMITWYSFVFDELIRGGTNAKRKTKSINTVNTEVHRQAIEKVDNICVYRQL